MNPNETKTTEHWGGFSKLPQTNLYIEYLRLGIQYMSAAQ